MYQVEFTERAESDLARLDKPIAQRVPQDHGSLCPSSSRGLQVEIVALAKLRLHRMPLRFAARLNGRCWAVSLRESMRVTDLTKDYLEFVLQKDAPEQYENCFPELFEYYYKFWAQPQPYFFRNADEILHRRNLILKRLPVLSEQFARLGMDFASIEIVLFVGHGTSNGHAFYLQGRWLVWLPIEGYHSLQAIDVFVSHEIAHALHYRRQPDFYFKNIQERNHLFRQLVTEGIATLTSKVVLGVSNEQALWADYLPVEAIQRWYKQCIQRENELLRTIAHKLESSDDENKLFSFSDTDDVFENRAGYYAGLILMERYLKQSGLSLQDLFRISKREFRHIIRSLLEVETD